MDFNVVRKPGVIRKAHRLYLELLEDRRVSGIVAAYDPAVTQCWHELQALERQHHSSFSAPLGIWPQYLATMDECGALAHVTPIPKPDLAAVGHDGHCNYEVLYDPGASQVVKKLVWEWLAQAPPICGIASFKLLSNDGWIVSEEEARSALENLDSHPAPDIAGWKRWIAFLRQAVACDGFYVT